MLTWSALRRDRERLWTAVIQIVVCVRAHPAVHDIARYVCSLHALGVSRVDDRNSLRVFVLKMMSLGVDLLDDILYPKRDDFL